MTDFNKEIQNLKNKLIDMEKNKIDINRNLDIIQTGINGGGYNRGSYEYSGSYGYDGSYIVTKKQDIDMITQLQAIHNILVVMNNKINDLEKRTNTQK